MKIVHVLDSLGMGGAETWLLGQLKYLQHHPELSVQVYFVLTGKSRGVLYSEFAQLAAEIYEIPIGVSKNWRNVTGLRKVFRNLDSDAVHFHSDFLSGSTQFLLLGLLPPVVVAHFHNPKYQQNHLYGVSKRKRLTLFFAKLSCALFSTHFLGTSADILQKYGVNVWIYSRIKKEAIYCFFDTKKYLKRKTDLPTSSPYNLLFIGRLDSSIDRTNLRNHKNSGLVLLIVAKIIESGHDCHLVMLGKNDHSLSLHKKLIDDLGLNNHVHLAGIQKDVVPFLSNADLLLFPSREEGMGLVAVEAQLAKVRVLKSHGVPDEVVCVPSAVESLQVDSSLEDWSQKAIDLLHRMPNWSDADFGAFDIDRQFPELLNIYRDGR